MIQGNSLFYLLLLPFTLIITSCQVKSKENGKDLDVKDQKVLNHITSFKLGKEGESSVEVLAYDELTKNLYVINSLSNKISIVNISKPQSPKLVKEIAMSELAGGVNSIASKNGIIAIAAENFNPQKNGWVYFMDPNGTILNKLEVGPLPDMLLFSPDGSMLLTANEGEPDNAYKVDPEGSISIISLGKPVKKLSGSDVVTLGFSDWNEMGDTLRRRGVRIDGPKATVAQDLEPEYIAISKDSKKAFVTLQENNAIAIVDLVSREVSDIKSLGCQSFSSCGLDASQPEEVKTEACSIKGMYYPDAIASFHIKGKTYLITANEGESRDYSGLLEEENINKKLFDEVECFGGRSFSIWSDSINLVYDSGNLLEKLTSEHPASKGIFNSSNDSSKPKKRSDDKGPEPEGVTTASVSGKTLAFVTLERVGGVMVFDVSNPDKPEYLQYINNRNNNGEDQDLGPETVLFLSASTSPDSKPLLLVANEVSSTIGVYRVNEKF